MKTITVNFEQCYLRYHILEILRKYYNVQYSYEPEFLFYGWRNNEFLYYPENTIKIFCSAEPAFPNFNYCDYAIGTYSFNFEDRYFRYPYSFYYVPPEKLANISLINNPLNRKFCNFIYWNTSYGEGPKFRENFCKQLSEYKKVDCPGISLNNMTSTLPSRYEKNWETGKIDFISNYKFTIAFENAFYNGYITEKLTHPFIANSVPIYFGAQDVDNEFNHKSFINVRNYNDFHTAIDYIIYCDNHDDEYMKILNSQKLNENFDYNNFYFRFERFIINIIESSCKKTSIISRRFDPPSTLALQLCNLINDKILTPNLPSHHKTNSFIRDLTGAKYNSTNASVNEAKKIIDDISLQINKTQNRLN